VEGTTVRGTCRGVRCLSPRSVCVACLDKNSASECVFSVPVFLIIMEYLQFNLH
jgi:hypothetical protein